MCARAATRQRGPENAAQMARMSQTRRRGPKNAVQMARMSQTWRRAPKDAVRMARMSQTWQRGTENAVQMAHMSQIWRRGAKNAVLKERMSQTWRRGPKNAVQMARTKTRGRAICAAGRIHPLGRKKEIQSSTCVRSPYGSGGAYIPGAPGGPCRPREQRRDRMRPLARRTGRGPDWRDKCPLEERISCSGCKAGIIIDR